MQAIPIRSKKAKMVAVIGALYQAIKGELYTYLNFSIQGHSFQENLQLGTLIRLKKVEDKIVAVKVQVGAGTFKEENRVKNLEKQELNDKKVKEGEQKLRNQCKKADKNASKVAKKRAQADQKNQELAQIVPAVRRPE